MNRLLSLTLLCVLLTVAAAGCGQKGKLYLPEAPPAAPADSR